MYEDEYSVGLFKKLLEIDDFGELDDCIVVQTPSGGYHIYGEYFKDLPNKNDILPKIDIRNDGGCIFFTNEHQIIKYSNDVDTQVNRLFLQSIKEYMSTKVNAENQVREITLNSAISSTEDKEEYVEMIVNTDLLSTVLSKMKKERFENYRGFVLVSLCSIS